MILYHAYGKCLQLGWVKLIAQAHIMYGRDDIAKLEVSHTLGMVDVGKGCTHKRSYRFTLYCVMRR